MSQIIKIENLNLWYRKGEPDEIYALKNINLEIEKGDYVAFFGSANSGKTSISYSISGVNRFQEGFIYIKDRDISTLSNQELAIFKQTGVGLIFQKFNLIPSLNVLKNVTLPMTFIGISSSKAEFEAKKILERLNLTKYADKYPYELSGIEQQRVGIARALANNPPIIIADEPLSNLDSGNAKIVLDLLKDLNEKDGRTVIIATHEAWSLRDVKTVFNMKDGEIINIEKINNDYLGPDSFSNHFNDQIPYVSEQEPSKNNKVEEERISAHVLSNFLLRGYHTDEIKKFESILNERFDNKIDEKEFIRIISEPIKNGGLGLWKKKAEKVVKYIGNIIEKRKDVAHIYKIIEDNRELSISDEIYNIRNWLIDGYKGKLSQLQIMAFDEVIFDRIKGLITADKVIEFLDLSNNKFGVGLSFKEAKLMSEKLELILVDDKGEFNSSNGFEKK